MTTKTLIITLQGTAREINTLGEKPDQDEPRFWTKAVWKVCPAVFMFHNWIKVYNDWKFAEDSLKEYKIESMPDYYFTGDLKPEKWRDLLTFMIGTIHECEVNEEDKTAVIL